MNKNIFQDEAKIKTYAHLQEELCKMKPNASYEEIDNIIKLIPAEYLKRQDELRLICQLFSFNARVQPTSKKGNSLKLFERILIPLKTHLKNESNFFWTIFAGHFYFKLWMYEQGLISIETIIEATQEDDNSVSEYFYPEIYEKRPDIFEYETKYKLNFIVTRKTMTEFKTLREKHLKWLLTSSDFHDPSYLEIEKNRLRLSIKLDDVESFQNILSNTNLSINSKISESVIENFFFIPHEVPIINYVVEYNSMNIFKFLIMKNVELNQDLIYNAISNNNYEIIHIIESRMPEKFKELALTTSIKNWSNEITEYALDNHEYEFLSKSDVSEDKNSLILDIIYASIISSNFIFFQSTLLPFLRKNPEYVKKHTNEILNCSASDQSCYFINEFMNLPNIDFNVCVEIQKTKTNFIGRAIFISNVKAVEIALKSSNIIINDVCLNSYPPFLLACRYNSDIKVLEMISNYKNFDVNTVELDDEDNVISVASFNGNFFALQFVLNKYNGKIKINKKNVSFDIYCCIKHQNFLTLKIIVKFYSKYFDSYNDLLECFRYEFSQDPDFDEEYTNQLEKIINDILNES